MSAESIQSLFALGLGFAVAGLFATAYQLVAQSPPSFTLLERGPVPAAFAAVPFLVFTAPFIIMRNTIHGCRTEGRRFEFVMMATILAGFWSLMSGTIVVMVLHALGLPGV
jgi:hypothetical protein